MNVTVPVGVPPAEAATVAVSVTGWPKTAGLADVASVVVVAAAVCVLPTVCVRAGAALPV